ncbi:MAG: ribosome maturation factor RimM [Rhizobiaceae bacterium]|nr:ribosome maturation factor RimM [Rhizobiaceae bacterium]
MTDAPNLILLAQIGAPHGIKGEVRVKPFGDPDMLDQYGRLETKDGRKLKIKRMRPQKNMLVVKFEGVNTREEAEALNRIELFIDRAKLPDPDDDEFYVSDLIGMTVMIEGAEAGRVKDVPNFGAGDMIEVEPSSGGATYYLPFTEAVVPEINFEAGELIVVPQIEVSERDEQKARQTEDLTEKNSKQEARQTEGLEGKHK